LGLAAVTLAAFWPLYRCGFVNYDDPFYVGKNLHVQEGLSRAGIQWAFTTTSASNWHPLTWLSLQLDYQIYGLNPAGYHITNLLLHAANALLLFCVFCRMTGVVGASAFVAAFFAVHPLHVEPVAWITERKEVLSALFGMLALLAYVRYVERPSLWRYGCVAAAFALGLAAKPMLVTFPFLLLLLDYWPLGRLRMVTSQTLGRGSASGSPAGLRSVSLKSAILEKLPLLVFASVSCVITLLAQHRGGNLRGFEEIPLSSRAANAVTAYSTYLTQTWWPHNLAAFYPLVNLEWSDRRVWTSVLVLMSITFVAAWQARRRPFFLVGWLWYVGTLVPVIGLVQIGDQAQADRYTYLPLIGVFVILAWAVEDLTKQGGLVRGLALTGTAAALIACLFLTRSQVHYWQDSETLWKHAIAATGPNAKARYGLGAAYRDEGRLAAAAAEFRRALAIQPNYNLARLNLGWCLLLQNNITEADAAFATFLLADSDSADGHLQLGNLASSRNLRDTALAHFTRALRLRPANATGHLRLAQELTERGAYEAARRHLREAERCDPRVRYLPEFQSAVAAASK
jgi:tetratricopeptide (TPR) repeat protein